MKDYDILMDDMWKEFFEGIDARIVDSMMETIDPDGLRFRSATEAYQFKKYNTHYPRDESETKISWYVDKYKWTFLKTMFPTM